jgi:hypothetical protein
MKDDAHNKHVIVGSISMHRIEIGMGMEQPTFKNNLGTLFETLDSHAKKFQIMINYFLLNFLIILQSWCSLNQGRVVV